MGCEHKAKKPGRAVPCVCVFSALTGAGAGPRGQCRLAACAGVPQGALPVRATCPGGIGPPVAGSASAAASLALITNHFAFVASPSLSLRSALRPASLAELAAVAVAVASGQVMGPARPFAWCLVPGASISDPGLGMGPGWFGTASPY
jgi:hypothetical protein